MTLAEQWMAEGEAKGRAEGEAKGRAQGIRQTLENLLRLKFTGDVDDMVIARLAQADEAQLMSWTERVLDAASLADVFR